jgi:amino acid adenylation domain-containing protein/non-ribosomal peptide synthase protein (TIGR01720 family)
MSSANLKFFDLELTQEKSYWLQQLAGELPLAAVPLDFRRPAAPLERTESVSFDVTPQLAVKLERLCASNDSLLFTVLATALKVCLHKYTGLEDIVIGTTIHEKHGHVAALNKVLVLRARISAASTPRQLLEDVRRTVSEAYAHQKYPFERLVEALNIETTGNRAPLFSTVLVFDRINNAENVRHLKNDLTVAFSRGEGASLSGSCEFNPGLFKRATIEVFAKHYLRVLHAILDAPDEPVSTLSLLTASESDEALFGFNDTARSYPKHEPIQRLFAEQARRTPDDTAVVNGEQTLSYSELDRRSNQLAHHLRRLGACAGVRVGICLEHSPETIVGLLGTLKAGATYVPLDPGHPHSRLDFMLNDAQARLLLTEEALADRLPKGQAEVIRLDADWKTIAEESTDDPGVDVNADTVAYVIYTSGSTGQPKGVQIRHSSLVNYVCWARDMYLDGESLDFSLYSSLAFDLTVTSIFTPLITGGRIVIYQGDRREAVITRILQDGQTAVLKLTPSHLALIKDADNSRRNVKKLIVGGEPLETALSREIYESFGGKVDIFNEYGPTEATVGCMIHRYDPAADDRAFVPIGRPAANTQIYLLDESLRPVPENVVGELYISGDGVAEGYYNRDELSTERFIDNPFIAGRKMYKTGDMARRLPEGVLDFVGRADDQVKFHGHRIELNELRSALNRHTQVRDSVLVVAHDENGHDVMVAYYVSRHELEPAHLRAFLSESMMEEVVPNVFVHLKRLPLTLNGKVNVRALPTLQEAREQLKRAYAPPRTDAEQTLSDIWAQVLCLDRVGIHENFFELGGDSILSIRIIAKAKQSGLHLTPKQLFQHQTVAELAAVAGTTPGVRAEQGLVTGPVPLTPIQRWFFAQNLPDPHHFNQALMLKLNRQVDAGLLRRVLEHLQRHHDALRLTFEEDSSGWRQFNSGDISGDVESSPLTLIDLSSLPGAERASSLREAAAELQAGLNLTRGPLMRAALIDLDGHGPDRLLLIIHHLAVDGVSWRILLEDLETACAQLQRGEPLSLPPKTTSFKHWAEWLTVYAASADLRQELDYWREAADGAGTRLPTDSPAGKNTVASAQLISRVLEEEETRALLQEAPGAYNTQINDLLLTAQARVCARWTGKSRLLIDLEGHGREEISADVDVSRTVGWFTSSFPFALVADSSDGPGDDLKSMKERLRLVPNHGIGYGLLRYLSGEQELSGELSALPPAEVSFNYLGRFDESLPESSTFSMMDESCGPTRGPGGMRTHLLDINASVSGGRLRLYWSYSRNLHAPATIEHLADEYVEELRALIAHCVSPEAGGFTPSDFPDADLTQQELDDLLTEINDSVGQD